jgi:single-strand selective monofunctional uracil DNA glycosylase
MPAHSRLARAPADGIAAMLDAARTLSAELAQLRFPPPVAHVYDPHRYAWAPYEQYVTRYGKPPSRSCCSA